MKKIGIDIDEVLSETVAGFLAFYNEKHGTQFYFDQIVEYSFSKIFGITPEIEKSELMAFFASTSFAELATVNGSNEAIKELSKNYELYAVSSRPPQLMKLTSVWLNKHFQGCFKEVILIDSHFDSSKNKSQICLQKHLDYFVEDVLSYAEDCAGSGVEVFLLDKPWNQGTINSKNIIRVKNWLEIVETITK